MKAAARIYGQTAFQTGPCSVRLHLPDVSCNPW